MIPILVGLGLFTSYLMFGADVYKTAHENEVILSCRINHSGQAEGRYYFVLWSKKSYVQVRAVYQLCIEDGPCSTKNMTYVHTGGESFESPFEKITMTIPPGTKSFKVIGTLLFPVQTYTEKKCQLLSPD